MSEYIKRLISEGEHQKQDFKFEINDSKRIARTISAFSNTDGGRLLIGVKDNGAISGINSEEEIHMVEAAANMYCKPIVNLRIGQHSINKKHILIVSVDKNEQNLIKAIDENGKYMVYLRRNDEVFKANYVYIRAVHLRKNKNIKIKYTEKEKEVLSTINKSQSPSLSFLSKNCKINKKKLSEMLARFIAIDIVKIDFFGEKISYSLNDPK